MLSLRHIALLSLPIAVAASVAACGDETEATTSTTTTTATTGSGGGATTSSAAGGAATTSATGGGATVGSGGSGGGTGGMASTPTVNCDPPSGNLPALQLTEFVTGLSRPMLIKAAPGDNDRLYIVQQRGLIKVLENGTTTDFLDVTSLVNGSGNERGLLGLAFHPNYAQNGRFFIHYTQQAAGGDTKIAEYQRSSGDPAVADPTEVATIYTASQPYTNHNGGSIEFSPVDGYLYIGLGDGGDADDPLNHGQDRTTPLGTILRLDVDSGSPYAIPAGNLNGQNDLGEIWDFGLRNPWRFSFDACNGNLYIGDVGQNAIEEIDVAAAGSGNHNWGWRLKEGTACFNPSNNCDPGGLTEPAVEYSHSGGACSVTGGYVYRGSAIPALRGAYLYADYCTGQIWMFRWDNGTVSDQQELTSDLQSGGINVASFGQDHDGEVYVVSLGGTIYRVEAE